MKWLTPILVHNCFQLAINGGTRVEHTNTVPHYQKNRQFNDEIWQNVAKCGNMWQHVAHCGELRLRRIAVNWRLFVVLQKMPYNVSLLHCPQSEIFYVVLLLPLPSPLPSPSPSPSPSK